jgi:hypothetical protein
MRTRQEQGEGAQETGQEGEPTDPHVEPIALPFDGGPEGKAQERST